MPIRLTGPLPIKEISDEFGGILPHELGEYYSDGVFLSKGYAPSSPPVPKSGNPLSVGDFYGRGKVIPLSLTITTNRESIDVFNVFKASGIMNSYPNENLELTLIIQNGVTISGNYASKTPALTLRSGTDATRTNNFKATDLVNIINNGNIIGYAGVGGIGGLGLNAIGTNGEVGGTALFLSSIVSLTNNGTIAGGANGGRGGTGGRTKSTYPCGCSEQCYTGPGIYDCCEAWGACNTDAFHNQVCKWYSMTCGKWSSYRQNGKNKSSFQSYNQWGMGPKSTVCTSTCEKWDDTRGGTGGNGASPFLNVGGGGGASGGGNDPASTAGFTGGTWGGGNWVDGFSNIRTTVGNTKLGTAIK
jgi:hypothetical protein